MQAISRKKLYLGVSVSLLALTSPARAQEAPSNAGSRSDEIVVTAQKTTQRLIDVPVPVSVVGAQDLIDENIVKITDYYTRVPGLQVGSNPGGQGGISALSLRGITTGAGTNPTLAVLIDDVQFGASTSAGAASFPDLDPAILERIEVLRGPQGTLYGASSLGGLLKFVTKDPDTGKFWGRAEAGFDIVEGGKAGWSGRGLVNVPIIQDRLAAMVSGFYRREPQWLENIHPLAVAAGQTKNVNGSEAYGGNAKVELRATDRLTITGSALYQKLNTENMSNGIRICAQCQSSPPGGPPNSAVTNFTPLFGYDTLRAAPSYGSSKYQFYSVKAEYDLDDTKLTSLTAWNATDWFQLVDVSQSFPFIIALYNRPGAVMLGGNANHSTKFSQELRIEHQGETFDVLAGLFYTKEHFSINQYFTIIDAAGAFVATPNTTDAPGSYEEKAVFLDVTYHVTPKLDVQLGGRYAHNDQTYEAVSVNDPVVADFFDPSSVTPLTKSDDNVFTWLVTPSYHISDDMMVYARVASGFRPGGPNSGGVSSIPNDFHSDRVVNYELGFKGYLTGDHSASIDISAFQIDWDDIQLQNTDSRSGLSFFTNGQTARSRGVEAAAHWAPWQGFSLDGNVTYTDAVLTADLPQDPNFDELAGAKGDRLPFSAKFAANIGAKQKFDLSDRLSANMGINYSYTGSRWSEFQSENGSRPRFKLPSYGITDIRAGLNFDELVSVNLFVRNVFDVHGVTSAANGNGLSTPSARFIRPRSAGVNVAVSF